MMSTSKAGEGTGLGRWIAYQAGAGAGRALLDGAPAAEDDEAHGLSAAPPEPLCGLRMGLLEGTGPAEAEAESAKGFSGTEEPEGANRALCDNPPPPVPPLYVPLLYDAAPPAEAEGGRRDPYEVLEAGGKTPPAEPAEPSPPGPRDARRARAPYGGRKGGREEGLG